MTENAPDTNVGKTKYFEDQTVFDALEKVAGLFPYKTPGNADTYTPYNEAWNDAIGRAEMEMETLLPADVAPVAHAHWIDGYRWQTCSKCRNKGKRSWKFCPSCGSKMDGHREEKVG